MVAVVKVPNWARKYFSANSLSGWPDGVRYTVRGKKKRKIRSIQLFGRAMNASSTTTHSKQERISGGMRLL